jgi:hypothetical protein
MIPKTKWQPSQADIDWQKNMLAMLADDGTWAVPISQSVFEINKPKKQFWLCVGNPKNETNKRIAAVFIEMGYRQVSKATKNRITQYFDN